jgi:hypothetical protein
MITPSLIDAAQSAPLPAPNWFIQFFKALGFTLHMVPMNLWYAGLIVAVVMHFARNTHARACAERLIAQMPIIVAMGVNLGIVPLLFIQVEYYKLFYPATILMAWFWLAIIVLLIPAYYGIYIYASGLGKGENRSINFHCRAAGCIAAVFFIAIGFIFANGLSLMDNVGRWDEIWSKTNAAGAALGIGLNTGDPTLLPRWFLMFGLALGTTAAWTLADAVFFNNKSEEYLRWIWKFAKILFTLGMIWTATAGAWYVFGAWNAELRKTMFSFPAILLTLPTALAPGLPWILIMIEGRFPENKRLLAAGIALAQFGVLGLNAVSRQVVQNVNISAVFDVLDQKTDIQWGPMAMFLVAFLLGLAVLAWMLAQVLKLRAQGEE